MFKLVIETLLQGQFICQTATPDAFDYLSQTDHFTKVTEYLALLDRELCSLDGDEIYYAAYTVVDDSNRGLIKDAFSEIRSQLRPVVEWMDMVMTASGQDMPIRARDEIRLQMLLNAIEQEPSLTEQMHRLTQLSFFKTAKTTIIEQLNWILQQLEKHGYLVKPNPQGTLYIVTGKMNYLHQLIAFLNDAEALGLDQQKDAVASQNQDLFS